MSRKIIPINYAYDPFNTRFSSVGLYKDFAPKEEVIPYTETKSRKIKVSKSGGIHISKGKGKYKKNKKDKTSVSGTVLAGDEIEAYVVSSVGYALTESMEITIADDIFEFSVTTDIPDNWVTEKNLVQFREQSEYVTADAAASVYNPNVNQIRIYSGSAGMGTGIVFIVMDKADLDGKKVRYTRSSEMSYNSMGYKVEVYDEAYDRITASDWLHKVTESTSTDPSLITKGAGKLATIENKTGPTSSAVYTSSVLNLSAATGDKVSLFFYVGENLSIKWFKFYISDIEILNSDNTLDTLIPVYPVSSELTTTNKDRATVGVRPFRVTPTEDTLGDIDFQYVNQKFYSDVDFTGTVTLESSNLLKFYSGVATSGCHNFFFTIHKSFLHGRKLSFNRSFNSNYTTLNMLAYLYDGVYDRTIDFPNDEEVYTGATTPVSSPPSKGNGILHTLDTTSVGTTVVAEAVRTVGPFNMNGATQEFVTVIFYMQDSTAGKYCQFKVGSFKILNEDDSLFLDMPLGSLNVETANYGTVGSTVFTL